MKLYLWILFFSTFYFKDYISPFTFEKIDEIKKLNTKLFDFFEDLKKNLSSNNQFYFHDYFMKKIKEYDPDKLLFKFFYPFEIKDYYDYKYEKTSLTNDRFIGKNYYDITQYFEKIKTEKNGEFSIFQNKHFFDPLYNHDELFEKFKYVFKNMIISGLEVKEGSAVIQDFFYFKFKTKYFLLGKDFKEICVTGKKGENFLPNYPNSTNFLFLPSIMNDMTLNFEEFMLSVNYFNEKYRIQKQIQDKKFYLNNLKPTCKYNFEKIKKFEVSLDKIFHFFKHIGRIIREYDLKVMNEKYFNGDKSKKIINFSFNKIIFNDCEKNDYYFDSTNLNKDLYKDIFNISFDSNTTIDLTSNSDLGFLMRTFKTNSYQEIFLIHYIVLISRKSDNDYLKKLINYNVNEGGDKEMFMKLKGSKPNLILETKVLGPKLMKAFNIFGSEFYMDVYCSINFKYIPILKQFQILDKYYGLDEGNNFLNINNINYNLCNNEKIDSLEQKKLDDGASLTLFLYFTQILFEYSIEKSYSKPINNLKYSFKNGFKIFGFKIRDFFNYRIENSSMKEKLLFALDSLLFILEIVINIPSPYIFIVKTIITKIYEVYSDGNNDHKVNKFSIDYFLSQYLNIYKMIDSYIFIKYIKKDTSKLKKEVFLKKFKDENFIGKDQRNTEIYFQKTNEVIFDEYLIENNFIYKY